MAMNQQWPSLADLPDDGDVPPSGLPAFDPTAASADELLFTGLQIARSGALPEAAEIFAKAILKAPESAEAYEALATVLVPLGKLEFASRAKAKAISLGYNSAASWDMLGDMLVGLGKFDDAAEAFQTSLDLDSSSAEVRMKRQAAVLRSTKGDSPASPAPRAPRAIADAGLFGPEFLSDAAVPPAWRRVNVVTIDPDRNPHSAAFEDLASSLENALRALGIQAERRSNSLGASGVNLVLGAHLIDSSDLADRIPWNTVIINLEQLNGFDVRSRPVYLSLLSRLAVWDYSVRNIDALRRITQNPYVRHFSVGYTPAMTQNLDAPEQPVDVLFYGSINARREAVLKALTAADLNVKHLFSVYGAARDQAIAEAKVILNMHFYEDSIHEIVRTSYLLANGKAVVTECGPQTEIDEDIRQAMVSVPYSDLVGSCVALVSDEPRRQALERRAFEIFSRRDQTKILRETIAATVIPALS
ncbi:MAG: tetratricopeptide repeat protein [Proteobacteria bacterium]|nr:tetratricopeptide repeat protein [Pseudomonadota bacterium]